MSPRKEQKEQSQRLRAHRRTGPTPGQGCGGRQPGRQQAGNGRASASGAVSQRCSAEHVSWAGLGHRARGSAERALPHSPPEGTGVQGSETRWSLSRASPVSTHRTTWLFFVSRVTAHLVASENAFSLSRFPEVGAPGWLSWGLCSRALTGPQGRSHRAAVTSQAVATVSPGAAVTVSPGCVLIWDSAAEESTSKLAEAPAALLALWL